MANSPSTEMLILASEVNGSMCVHFEQFLNKWKVSSHLKKQRERSVGALVLEEQFSSSKNYWKNYPNTLTGVMTAEKLSFGE